MDLPIGGGPATTRRQASMTRLRASSTACHVLSHVSGWLDSLAPGYICSGNNF